MRTFAVEIADCPGCGFPVDIRGMRRVSDSEVEHYVACACGYRVAVTSPSLDRDGGRGSVIRRNLQIWSAVYAWNAVAEARP